MIRFDINSSWTLNLEGPEHIAFLVVNVLVLFKFFYFKSSSTVNTVYLYYPCFNCFCYDELEATYYSKQNSLYVWKKCVFENVVFVKLHFWI